MELKSAFSSMIVPDTWLPTWTVVTASSVPVAAISLTIAPRLTDAGDDRRRGLATARVVGAGRQPGGGQQSDDDAHLCFKVLSPDDSIGSTGDRSAFALGYRTFERRRRAPTPVPCALL